jgi:hypothetical protein
MRREKGKVKETQLWPYNSGNNYFTFPWASCPPIPKMPTAPSCPLRCENRAEGVDPNIYYLASGFNPGHDWCDVVQSWTWHLDQSCPGFSLPISCWKMLNVKWNSRCKSEKLSLYWWTVDLLYNGQGCQFSRRRPSHAPLRGRSDNCLLQLLIDH